MQVEHASPGGGGNASQRDRFTPYSDLPAEVRNRISPKQYDAVKRSVQNLEEAGAMSSRGKGPGIRPRG
jgi:hypothetical protein